MKLLCISLGCDKNLVDTEMMLGLLNKDGYTFTDDEYDADVIVINTCCFIGDAKEESVNTNRRSSMRFRKSMESSVPPPMTRYPMCWPRRLAAGSTSSASTIWISFLR